MNFLRLIDQFSIPHRNSLRILRCASWGEGVCIARLRRWALRAAAVDTIYS